MHVVSNQRREAIKSDENAEVIKIATTFELVKYKTMRI